MVVIVGIIRTVLVLLDVWMIDCEYYMYLYKFVYYLLFVWVFLQFIRYLEDVEKLKQK